MSDILPERKGDRGAVPHHPFQRSLDPMLICDDERRCIDANVASCLFLRLARDVILRSAIDDLLAADVRPELAAMWPTFEQRRLLPLRALECELLLPDGSRVAVTLSVASFEPGRQLVIIDFPPLRELIDGVEHPRRGFSTLTRREREVLTLVAGGMTGIQIAAQLFLSPTTVQTHVNNALIKLSARNRAHGIALALHAGEIELGEREAPDGNSSPAPRRAF